MGGSLGKPGSGQSGRGQGPACEEHMGGPWSPSCHGSARGRPELALPVTPSLVPRVSPTPPTRGCAVGPQPWLVPLVSPVCDLSGLPHSKLQGSQPVLGHPWEEPAGESAHWGPNRTKARAVLRATPHHLPRPLLQKHLPDEPSAFHAQTPPVYHWGVCFHHQVPLLEETAKSHSSVLFESGPTRGRCAGLVLSPQACGGLWPEGTNPGVPCSGLWILIVRVTLSGRQPPLREGQPPRDGGPYLFCLLTRSSTF